MSCAHRMVERKVQAKVVPRISGFVVSIVTAIRDPLRIRFADFLKFGFLKADPFRIPSRLHQSGLPPCGGARGILLSILVPHFDLPVIPGLRMKGWAAIRHSYRLIGGNAPAVPDVWFSRIHQLRARCNPEFIGRLLCAWAGVVKLPGKARRLGINAEG